MHASASVCLGLIFLATACAEAPPEEPSRSARPIEPEASESADHRHELDVDWIQFPEADLYRASETIVRGRVTAQRFGLHRTYPVDPAQATDYAELPLTISTLAIEQRLFARGSTDSSTLEVVQLGGRYADGCSIEPKGQRLLRPDDDVIVYLRDADMVPHQVSDRRGMFSVIGGQQGLIPIRDGRVAPIEGSVFVRFAERPVLEIASEIESVAPVRGAR